MRPLAARRGGATTRFLYDPGSGSGAGGARVVAEYDEEDTLLRRYVPGAGLDETLVWLEGDDIGVRRLEGAIGERLIRCESQEDV